MVARSRPSRSHLAHSLSLPRLTSAKIRRGFCVRVPVRVCTTASLGIVCNAGPSQQLDALLTLNYATPARARRARHYAHKSLGALPMIESAREVSWRRSLGTCHNTLAPSFAREFNAKVFHDEREGPSSGTGSTCCA